MPDDHILLKIKREFTKDETVGALLKINSELQQEIGMLKGEVAELKHYLHKLQHGVKKKDKEWLEDDYIKELSKEIERLRSVKESVDEWRDKYFVLLNKKQ